MTIGDRIKKTRNALNISQTDLAEKIGSSKQTMHKYENNIVTNIPSDKIELIANVLGVTPAYLMGWEDNLNKSNADLMVDMIYDTELLNHVHKINKLSADDKKTIYDMIDFLFEKAGF